MSLPYGGLLAGLGAITGRSLTRSGATSRQGMSCPYKGRAIRCLFELGFDSWWGCSCVNSQLITTVRHVLGLWEGWGLIEANKRWTLICPLSPCS